MQRFVVLAMRTLYLLLRLQKKATSWIPIHDFLDMLTILGESSDGLAGTPTAGVAAGPFLANTAPAPMLQPFPSVTPGRIFEPALIQLSFSTVTGGPNVHREPATTLRYCVMRVRSGPIITLLPIVMRDMVQLMLP